MDMDCLSTDSMKAFKTALAAAKAHPPWQGKKEAQRRQWNPYSFEGSTSAAIAGKDFVVVGSDTRKTNQFEVGILTRELDGISVLSDSVMLCTAGFQGDVKQLERLLQARLHKFRFDYRCEMTADLCSEMLARNLYYQRFFPYYTGCILAGLDVKGRGAVYSYDPIGCIERLPYSSSGHAESMIQPFFDAQLGRVTCDAAVDECPPLTLERAVSLMKDAFRVSAERETNTGDGLRIVVAQAGKPPQQFSVPLRED